MRGKTVKVTSFKDEKNTRKVGFETPKGEDSNQNVGAIVHRHVARPEEEKGGYHTDFADAVFLLRQREGRIFRPVSKEA